MRAPVSLVVAVVLVGAVAPATAGVAAPSGAAAAVTGSAAPAAAQNGSTTTGNSSVDVTVGQQLSTVIQASSSNVSSSVSESSFEAEFEDATESEQAELLAERAETLRERASDIREEYREATAAYEAGETTRSAYARDLAVLNSRATDLLDSYDALQRRAGNVSGFELRAAGLNRTAVQESLDGLDGVTGTGASELLARFTGEREGEVELETDGGLSISVESEDGERSRELQRDRDETDTMTVTQSTALDAARSVLSATNGTWVLSSSGVHPDDGYYAFEFVLESNDSTGEAEVLVDGSSGTVFDLEEEIESADDRDEDREDDGEEGRDHDDDDHDEDDEVDELAMVVAAGTPAPGEAITVKVLADGAPAPDAAVTLNGDVVGKTGQNGTLAFVLTGDEAHVRARLDGEDAELEFEFEEHDDEDATLAERLDASATYDDGTVSLSLAYDGSGVSNVTVYADGRKVGTTDAAGTLSFQTNATDELSVRAVKGSLEVRLTFAVRDGSLVLTDAPQVGDADDEGDEEDDSDDEDGDDSDDEKDEGDEEDEEDERGDDEDEDGDDDGDEEDEEDEREDGEDEDGDDDGDEEDEEDDEDDDSDEADDDN